jgi:acetate kinase
MILILNCGSQSIKWKVYDLPRGKAGGELKLLQHGSRDVLNSAQFSEVLFEELNKITESINLIGHRVVHGGTEFIKPLQITEENLKELEKISHLAPLHNPYNLLGIKACQKIFKDVRQFAVFDTEFFADLPKMAYTYALPENLNFRRFGFQGTSHEYVANEAVRIIKKPFNKLKIITCHLGGGASVAAIKNGKAIDTSMGFTPLEGLVMMTRSGNVDAGIVLELVKQFGIEGTDKMLNKNSGIKGVCGEGDMLKVLSALGGPASGGEKAKYKLAFDVFVYSVQKYIGAYFAILGGCDVLVFTGSIGAGNPKTRNAISKLDILKKTKILAIKTDEELAIAKKIFNIVI